MNEITTLANATNALGLKGRTAIVTGSTSGIGLGIAQALAWKGANVALVSDAGMPGVSDPGYRLVHLAIRHGVQVVPIPGASAFAAALSASGLPIDHFLFLGFLPAKKLARRKALGKLKTASNALVFYEAPHRVLEMLEDVEAILGNRPVVVAREVTKVHEEFLRRRGDLRCSCGLHGRGCSVRGRWVVLQRR